MTEPEASTTVRLGVDIHREAKLAAIRAGMTLRRFVEDAVDRAIRDVNYTLEEVDRD